MQSASKSSAHEQGGRAVAPAAEATRTSAAARDNRPQAVAQRAWADAVSSGPKVSGQQALIRAVLGSPRAVAQARRLDALLGAAAQSGAQAHAAPVSQRGQDGAGGIRQMKIAMKGAGDARRTDGPYSALYDEVTASCNRADKAEMQKDYSDLGQSVKAREDYQKFPAHTEKWEKHRWRYMQEKNELVPYIKGLL